MTERNLMVAGFGGQGVMLLGKLLSCAACESTEKHVTFFPSYGAEQRGGTANCYVVISEEEIGAPLMSSRYGWDRRLLVRDGKRNSSIASGV